MSLPVLATVLIAHGPTAGLIELPSRSFLPLCCCAQDAANSWPFYQDAKRWRILAPSIFMVDSLEEYVSALEHREVVDVSFLYRFYSMIVT